MIGSQDLCQRLEAGSVVPQTCRCTNLNTTVPSSTPSPKPPQKRARFCAAAYRPETSLNPRSRHFSNGVRSNFPCFKALLAVLGSADTSRRIRTPQADSRTEEIMSMTSRRANFTAFLYMILSVPGLMIDVPPASRSLACGDQGVWGLGF